MKKAYPFLAGALMVFLCLQASGGRQQLQGGLSQLPVIVPSQAPRIDADFGQIPLQFIPNQGQMDGQVAYYVQGRDKTIYFTPEGLTFVLAEQAQKDGKKQPGPAEYNGLEPTQRWVVKLDFMDSNADAKPVGLEKSGAVISYFKGNPEEWKAGLTAYSKIVYRELWPGIDLLYYGTFNRMKYEFIVHPGADPSRIKLAYRGAKKVALTAEGQLEVQTPAGGFEDDIPIAYQETKGERTDVSVKYVLGDVTEGKCPTPVPGPAATPKAEVESLTHAYGFEIGEYDQSRPLVLDPAVLVYCGYIGGAVGDVGQSIAVDGSGNAYITGYSWSTEATFPVVGGPDLTSNGYYDAFVAKVNPAGTGLVYCGYIGGSLNEYGLSIAVDGSGNAYITGYSGSTEATFPVVGGPDLTYNGGTWDAFVAKVNPAGTGLVYCGYIGGSAEESGLSIAVDGSGNAYLTGYSASTEATFPVVGGPDLTYNGGTWDAFVAKIQIVPPSLASLLPSSATACDPGFTLSVIGSDFANGAVVRWDGSDRPTTFVNSLKLDAQIASADLTAGRIAQITVLNPDGGISSALDFSVAGFTISSSPTSATITAGQSAIYTIQVTPQYGPFNSSLSFSCTGLPSKCNASFLPTSVTPGANVVTTTLTLTTQAASGSASGVIFRSTGFVPPALSLLLIILALLIWVSFREPGLNKHFHRWLTAGALVCLIVLVVSCSAGGDGNPPSTGTPPGTYQVSVRGQSSCLTVSTTVTLIVR